MKKLFSSSFFLSVALVVLVFFGISGYFFEVGYPAWATTLVNILIGGLLLVILQFIISRLAPWLKKIPTGVYTTFFTGLLALYLMRMFAFGWPSLLFYTLVLFGLLCCLLLVVGIQNIIKKRDIKRSLLMVMTSIILPILGIYGFQTLDGDPFSKENEDMASGIQIKTLSAMGVQDPSSMGSYEVETFTYGSGADKKRPEYAEGVKLKTPTVDASLLLPDWKGKKKKWREKFWGFGVKNFPLNGRVYMPKGEGPFPLVLMVHGNHSMIDYSDGGYAYLGELLASRGAIAVSVDENFINAHWSGDFRGKEMPARGWLLLKHLEQWKKWNAGGEESLEGKVDMNNIVLIGHSRGGEAVSIAAAFNNLKRFPDDAKERFNFGFGIKGIVTVAPTDYRYNREINLENINYLSLQGAWDSDETSFWGMRPFHRLKFTDGFEGFKAGLYINHANHGQFNSTWGRSDFGAPMKWLLNLKPLMTGEDQRQVAKVYISAFVESVLKDNPTYRPMFQNVETAKNWLPKETYLSQYGDNKKDVLVDFEEDLDVTSGSKGIQIEAKNFKVWKEEELLARDGGSQQNNAVVLGWRYAMETQSDSLPIYSIQLPEQFKDISMADTLVLSIAAGDLSTLKRKNDKKGKTLTSNYDFSIAIVDSLGTKATVGLGESNVLPKQVKSKFTKFQFLDKEMIGKDTEVQLKTCYLALSAFKPKTDSLHLDKIKYLQLVFDKDSIGVVVVDDIGFRKK